MHEQTLAFESDGLSFEGTLLGPASDAPCPGVLLVSGSGPIDRDSNMKRAPLGVMKQIAEHLALIGFASFRFDKRGVGASGGDYKASGLFDNIADARAALLMMRGRPELDAERLFVLGHSEGALIAAELAAKEPLAGAVLLASAAVPGKAVLRWQAAQVAETLPKWVRFIMKLLRQDFLATQEKRMAQLEATTKDVERISLVKVNAKWFREFMSHDPAKSLSRISAPVLAITGAKDLQVDPNDVQRMGELVRGPFEGKVLDDLTHLLRCDPGPASVSTYKAQMREPVDAQLLRLVGEWFESVSN